MAIHDFRVEKPATKPEYPISDPVNVFHDSGLVTVAYWDERDKRFHELEGETYDGGVVKWADIIFPSGWNYDSDVYGGDTISV